MHHLSLEPRIPTRVPTPGRVIAALCAPSVPCPGGPCGRAVRAGRDVALPASEPAGKGRSAARAAGPAAAFVAVGGGIAGPLGRLRIILSSLLVLFSSLFVLFYCLLLFFNYSNYYYDSCYGCIDKRLSPVTCRALQELFASAIV